MLNKMFAGEKIQGSLIDELGRPELTFGEGQRKRKLKEMLGGNEGGTGSMISGDPMISKPIRKKSLVV
jgi:hypothetical protein